MLELIIRKIIVAIATCSVAFLTFSLLNGVDFSLFALMYLMPIVFLFGMPVSVLSDFALKSFKGFTRRALSLFIHVVFATLFILTPTLVGWEWDIMYMDIQEILNNFFFISAILTASLFWLLDEILRIKLLQDKCRLVLNTIGDLKV